MKYLPYIFLWLMALACVRVPDGVIGQDVMAHVLADMYMAESYVDQNHAEFGTDSARRVLKQSILAKYGYASADFDSSLMWYGKHSDIYIKVNDEVMDILKERDRDLGSAILAGNASFYGDSVDVWSGSRYAMVHKRLPSRLVSFEVSADDNQQRGDQYSWRVKMMDDNLRSIRWVMLAQYADSTCDYINTTTSNMGWNEVVFNTDSTKNLISLKGYFEPVADMSYSGAKPKSEAVIWLDSISLIRKRMNPEIYGMQRGRVTPLKNLYYRKHRPDSLASSESPILSNVDVRR